jgi:hypothetical protein
MRAIVVRTECSRTTERAAALGKLNFRALLAAPRVFHFGVAVGALVMGVVLLRLYSCRAPR